MITQDNYDVNRDVNYKYTQTTDKIYVGRLPLWACLWVYYLYVTWNTHKRQSMLWLCRFAKISANLWAHYHNT